MGDPTVIAAAAVSLPAFRSVWSTAVIVAVFVIVLPEVPASTSARTTSTAPAAGASAPTVQTPVPATYAPCVGVAERNVSPAGSRSPTAMPVAPSGPVLVTATVKLT